MLYGIAIPVSLFALYTFVFVFDKDVSKRQAMYDDKEFQQADKELKIVVEKMQENLSDCRRMDVIQELYDNCLLYTSSG